MVICLPQDPSHLSFYRLHLPCIHCTELLTRQPKLIAAHSLSFLITEAVAFISLRLKCCSGEVPLLR